MSTEVAIREDQEISPTPQVEPSLLQVIARAAQDPSIDVAKMQALLDMQERIQSRAAEIEFNGALSRILNKVPRVPKKGSIIVKGVLRSKYIPFENVDEALRPLLAEEGLSVSFGHEPTPKGVCVSMEVRHVGGHKEKRQLELPIDSSDFRSAIQNNRSSESFAKRCLLVDFFNIVAEGEDKDGADCKLITEQQARTLEDMLQATDSKKEQFLHWLGVSKMSEIPQAKYESALAALKRKASK